MSTSQGPRRVRELMRTELKTLGRNDPLVAADRLMETERIRHLLILDEEGRLAGVISQRDIFFNALLRALGFGARAKEHAFEGLRAKDCMVENVVTIPADATLSRAASVMSQMKVGCLPVLEGDQLVGIITESDLVRVLAEQDD